MTDFLFLNPNFLDIPAKSEVDVDEYLALKHIMVEEKSPMAVIERRASQQDDCEYQKLAQSIFQFRMIFLHKKDANFSIFFKDRTTEEWCLLYWEVYFWKCFKARHYLPIMLEKGFLQKNIKKIYTSGIFMFNPYRNFPEFTMRSRLEELLRDLKMSQISNRKDFASFNVILKVYEQKLENRAFQWMMLQFDKFDKWSGQWYIFDRGLFMTELVSTFESQVVTRDELNEAEQQLYADMVFVITLVGLTKGEIEEWKHVREKISYDLRIQEILKFKIEEGKKEISSKDSIVKIGKTL